MHTSTMKILYNNCYGCGFAFSDAFVAEYEARAGRKVNMIKALFQRGLGSIRCDPVAVGLVEEKGSRWASAPGSEIAIREIPDVLERYWEIEENDGDEYVRLLVSEALADILHEFMDTGDRDVLNIQYAAITETIPVGICASPGSPGGSGDSGTSSNELKPEAPTSTDIPNDVHAVTPDS